MDKILTVELSGRNDTYAVAQLPLTPYELLDTLDKLRMTPRDEPEWEILAYHDYAELRDWIGSGSAYELNALCTRFSELNGQERLAFEGLVQMDKDKGLKIIPMHRLLDLAYSTGQCHLLEDVHNLDQLGRFAAENGFVPEAGHLPDEAFELLDFKRIGERFMRDEGGVIVKGGYVAQDGDLARDVWKTLELTPREPDYAVLVELGVMDTDRAALLKLPAPPAELDAALDRVEAETWDEITYRCADCRVPALRDAITLADNIAQANRAAVYLARLPEQDVPKYKALISALGITELHDALELTERLDEYLLAPEHTSYEDAARSELRFMLGDEGYETLLPYVNLYQYGKALQEKYRFALTDYGSVERADGQPMLAQDQLKTGEMEMTQGVMTM